MQVDCSEWDRYDFTDLEKQIWLAKQQTSYCFVQDLQGQASRYFQYKGRLFELGDEIKRIQAGSQTLDGAAEKLRASIVLAMRQSDILCINLDSQIIDFNQLDSAHLPIQTVLDSGKGRLPENVLRVVMPDERFL